MRPRVKTWLIVGGGLLTFLYLLAFAFNATPYLRGPDAWRWAYAIPGKPWRHLVPVTVVTMYVILAFLWIRRLLQTQDSELKTQNPKLRMGFLFFVTLTIPFIQAALLFPESSDIIQN